MAAHVGQSAEVLRHAIKEILQQADFGVIHPTEALRQIQQVVNK